MRCCVLFCVLAVAAASSIGCVRSLPTVKSRYLDERLRTIPQSAAPVFSWHAERKGLKTYWLGQNVSVEARAHVPLNQADPTGGTWEIRGRNSEGKPVLFIGIRERYTNSQGTELAVIVPPLDLDEVPDGLYLFLEPNISVTLGKVTSIAPVVVLTEIRDHMFKPFQVPIPLIPDRKSPLTPAPPLGPSPPEGTPIGLG